MKPDEKGSSVWVWAFGLIPVVWLALLVAPAVSGGIPEIIEYFPAAMSALFHIEWCEDSVKTALLFIAIYGIGIGIYLHPPQLSQGRRTWLGKMGRSPGCEQEIPGQRPIQNRIFTQHVRMGLDGRKHRRTLNTLVCGGSGAGKSRFYGKVNLCQANTSYFVLDCKGELLRDCGGLLARMGYEIKVVDLLNMEKSHCYNPLPIFRATMTCRKW